MKAWRVGNTGTIQFHCPGCGMVHAVNDDPVKEPCWKFNGDFENPSFHPSVLVFWDFGEQREKKVCHSFVREGKIQFLNDCTHSMAGKTVELPHDD